MVAQLAGLIVRLPHRVEIRSHCLQWNLLSAVASVITVYQLAASVTQLCFHYAQGVRSSKHEVELVMDEIAPFQNSLQH